MRGSTLIVLKTALFVVPHAQGGFPLCPQIYAPYSLKTGALSEKPADGYLSLADISFYIIILDPLRNFVNYLAAICAKNICQRRRVIV